jgi:CBS domain-containing protein
VSYDSQTDRSLVVSVVTQYRILKFVAVNVPETQKLRRPLKDINLGTYHDIATASMDTPVIDVIHKLVERSISSVPILNADGKFIAGSAHDRKGGKRILTETSETAGVVYNVFEAVDVITLIKGGVYDDLNLPVGEALKKRSPVRLLALMR